MILFCTCAYKNQTKPTFNTKTIFLCGFLRGHLKPQTNYFQLWNKYINTKGVIQHIGLAMKNPYHSFLEEMIPVYLFSLMTSNETKKQNPNHKFYIVYFVLFMLVCVLFLWNSSLYISFAFLHCCFFLIVRTSSFFFCFSQFNVLVLFFNFCFNFSFMFLSVFLWYFCVI